MVFSADELDFFLRSGAMERIGMGSRRSCYRLPGDGALCLKCYRSDAEIDEGREPGSPGSCPLSPGAVKEIRSCRFDEKRNTCCEEYRYWKETLQNAPPEIRAVFPASIEMVKLPSRGWCLIEEFMTNDDGTPVVKFLQACVAADRNARYRLFAALKELESMFVAHAVRFFDPQTIMVQYVSGEARLRIPDFEPAARTLLPVDRLFPALVRMKVHRRFARYRKMLGIK